MRRRAVQSRRPCANGSSIVSVTSGMARNTGATHGSAATAIRSPRSASVASKGSAITASPIHCGATTSVRVTSRPRWLRSMGVDLLARLQAVLGAAIRALADAGGGDIDEDARVVAPERHLRVRAEHHAGALKLGGGELDRGLRSIVGHRDQTLVSHSAYLGLRPLTMSKNALCIF